MRAVVRIFLTLPTKIIWGNLTSSGKVFYVCINKYSLKFEIIRLRNTGIMDYKETKTLGGCVSRWAPSDQNKKLTLLSFLLLVILALWHVLDTRRHSRPPSFFCLYLVPSTYNISMSITEFRKKSLCTNMNNFVTKNFGTKFRTRG